MCKCIGKMEKHKPVVCIDFDGVLNNYKFYDPDNLFDMRPGAYDFIMKLSVIYRVVILTARDTEKVKEWLRENDIVVDEVTNVKPPAVCYVDDRAVRFDGDFNRTLHEINHFYTFWELNYDE